jgi:pyruvate,orthophosphate dikinase
LHEFLPSVEELTLEIERLREFHHILKAMEELPDSIRSHGPSLRRYISPIEHILKKLSEVKSKGLYEELIAKKELVLKKVRELSEINPMLGHRGIRLGITYPEIYDMQMRAILEASAELIEEGAQVFPEIMVPQVCTAEELKWVYSRLTDIRREMEEAHKIEIPLKFGTMIEVVRACMRAGRLAEIAEFFSFGTNDLTQGTFSFSREDAESKFLPLYNERNILQDNPFEILDVKGVGRLMMITIEWGRRRRPDLKVGICGEHGGQPRSIEFCHNIGLDYVSCGCCPGSYQGGSENIGGTIKSLRHFHLHCSYSVTSLEKSAIRKKSAAISPSRASRFSLFFLTPSMIKTDSNRSSMGSFNFTISMRASS